jgi:hypothetical protein
MVLACSMKKDDKTVSDGLFVNSCFCLRVHKLTKNMENIFTFSVERGEQWQSQTGTPRAYLIPQRVARKWGRLAKLEYPST